MIRFSGRGFFAAAITQLDANPVRLLDRSNSHPGSPLQDLLQQDFMQAAIKNLTFRNLFVAWLSKTFNANFPLPNIILAEPASTASEGGVSG